MLPFLLIHGAWHGAWCWSRLVPELASRGRRAVAIDLPGAGNDPTPLAEVTLERWTDRISAALDALGEPAILLGHSMGGIAIAAAAEHAPEQVAKLVYLCAFLPRDGESLASLVRSHDADRVALRQIVSPDGSSLSVDPESLVPAFYADCGEEEVANARARLTPLATAPATAPVRLTPERYGRIERVYIECTEDRAIPIEAQRRMIAASPCAAIHTLAASHSPFLSMPGALADILARL